MQYFIAIIISPFVSGGTHGDRIREIWGEPYTEDSRTQSAGSPLWSNGSKGAFYDGPLVDVVGATSAYSSNLSSVNFRASLVVPTGNDNAPITLSVKYFRRIS